MWERLGKNQKKILLLLLGGLALGCDRRPFASFKIIKAIGRGWKEIDRMEYHSIRKSIKNLYKLKLVDTKENSNGAITLVLSDRGKKRALIYDIDQIKLKKPRKWDGWWRLIIFDIPEGKKKIREAFRFHLRQLEFYKLQKSVFVTPYECQNEINYLIEFYGVGKYVRYIEAKYIDNELFLERHFNIN